MLGPVDHKNIFKDKLLTDWICADCGNEQRSFGNCLACNSMRTSVRSLLIRLLGKNWRSKTFPS